jgi:hypothetical protein
MRGVLYEPWEKPHLLRELFLVFWGDAEKASVPMASHACSSAVATARSSARCMSTVFPEDKTASDQRHKTFDIH